jgi:hypothetical protein
MQKGVHGTASKRFAEIFSPQQAQIPYVPLAIRLRASRMFRRTRDLLSSFLMVISR